MPPSISEKEGPLQARHHLTTVQPSGTSTVASGTPDTFRHLTRTSSVADTGTMPSHQSSGMSAGGSTQIRLPR